MREAPMSNTDAIVEQTPDSQAVDPIVESAVNAVADALKQVAVEPLPEFSDPYDDDDGDDGDEPRLAESHPPRQPQPALQFATAAIVAFSLTLLAGSIAVLSGYVPLSQMEFTQRVDLGAILLFAPVCALVLALFFEVAVIALKAPLENPEPRRLPIDWAPGHREG